MGNFLADMEAAIDASDDEVTEEAPEEEEAEEEAPEEEEAEEEAPEEEEAEEEAPEEEEAEEEDDGTPTLGDKDKFRIGKETLTGKEIREGILRQADYTKKTQNLAAERKAAAEKVEELSDENEDLKDWVGSLDSVEDMAFELERYFPDTFKALKAAIIDEAIADSEMSEQELAAHRRAREAEFKARSRDKDDTYGKKKEEKRAATQRTAQLRQTFDSWLGETMEASGLDLSDERHQRLVRNEIATAFKGQTWTKDHFIKAANAVAKDLGKKPPKAKVVAKPVPAAKKLPPMHPVGKRPVKQAAKNQGKTIKKSSNTEDFFAQIRKNAGVR